MAFSFFGFVTYKDTKTPYLLHTFRYTTLSNGGEKQVITTPGEDLYLGEVENMADAILNGQTQRMSLADSRNNVAVIQALLRSALEGKPVTC